MDLNRRQLTKEVGDLDAFADLISNALTVPSAAFRIAFRKVQSTKVIRPT